MLESGIPVNPFGLLAGFQIKNSSFFVEFVFEADLIMLGKG
jgi:hypothetical protein